MQLCLLTKTNFNSPGKIQSFLAFPDIKYRNVIFDYRAELLLRTGI